jgi:hypothetical protein
VFRALLAERVATTIKKGAHVLVEGSLVSSTYEQPNGKGKKSKTSKITSWSVRADVVRIRHFGFLACRRRRTTLPLCFQLLGAAKEALTEEHTSSTEDLPDLYRCPKCGGPMKVIERLTAAEIQLRSPPRISSAA